MIKINFFILILIFHVNFSSSNAASLRKFRKDLEKWFYSFILRIVEKIESGFIVVHKIAPDWTIN